MHLACKNKIANISRK